MPKLLERLRHAETRAQIRRDIETVIPSWPSWEPGGWPHNLVEATGWDNVWVIWVASRTNKACEGKSVARLAAELGKDPFDVAADLILEERGQILALYIGVSGDLDEQWALRQIVQHPSASVETDAFSLGHGKPNPALVGSFPRILGQYVRDERLMTFADAIHKMTALSAERLQIQDRGVLCEGAWADITVVDAETVGDHSTYLDPDRPPSGIDYVLINGIVMVDQGETDTTTFAGQVLRAQGRR
ncbi:MAG: amidohydrolase family protein [Solirubrobacterales bacterium]